MLAAIGIVKGQPFSPDATTRSILDKAAKTAYKMSRVIGFEENVSGRSFLIYPDRHWVNPVADGTPSNPGGAMDLASTKVALIEVASETERDVIDPFFQWKHNGRPAGNGWNRSTNNARFGTDYFNRTGTAKSNMFDNAPEETQYFYTDDDSRGSPLDGTNGYTITFPAGALPPVNGFWISEVVSGPMRCTTRAPTSSANLASLTTVTPNT